MTDSVEPQGELAPLASPVPADSSAPSRLRIGRVLGVVLPVGLSLAGVAWFLGYQDGENKVREWLQPPRSQAEGRVYFGDEPLAGGEVRAKLVNSQLDTAVGFIDDEGRFKLKMDIRGRYEDGAFVGTHKVTVFKNDPKSAVGARAPDLLTPAEYANFETTPLTIQVDADASKNRYEIRLPRATPAAEAPKSPSSDPPVPQNIEDTP